MPSFRFRLVDRDSWFQQSGLRGGGGWGWARALAGRVDMLQSCRNYRHKHLNIPVIHRASVANPYLDPECI